MKRFLIFVSLIFTSIMLTACSRTTLYILNWAEYMSPDLIREFEKEHKVRVKVDAVDSNEIMYTKIKNKTTKYDIAVPSDYMIEKLYNENLLIELDKELLPNYKEERFDNNLIKLRSKYFEGNEKYNVPYFFGTIGIMYNNAKPGIKELVEQYEWEVFFNRSLIGKTTRVGMYNSSRDAVAAAALYLGYDINTTDSKELTEIEKVLTAMDYDMYGTDELKRRIAEQNLDIALVYSGDFFDALYGTMEDEAEVTYDMHVPNDNNIWFDAFVIPNTATNVELAHEFINFMIDTEVAYENAQYVGYCPTITEVFNKLKDDEDFKDIIINYPYYPIEDPETFNGEIYKDLGPTVYKQIEEIFQRSKSK